jgi:hypothetical protein
MGVKDVLRKMKEKSDQRKALLNSMDQRIRTEKIVQDRQKSANLRELERYMEEDREAEIKRQLEYARKKREHDINFGHNPIDAENIITKTQWHVLREKNQFAGRGNIFQGQESVLKNDSKLLRTNKKLLKSNNKLMKGGNLFKI